MSKKLLQVAVATAMGTAAGAAMAFNPTLNPPAYTIYMAGSTAATNTWREFTIQTVCDTSGTYPIDVFRRSGSNGFGNDWAVACHINTATGAAGKDVLILKRDNGGSGYGVTPVTNAVAADVMKIEVGTGKNCDDSLNPPTTQTTSGGTSYTQHVCGAANVSGMIPDIGFSDVEPGMFRGINNPGGGLPDYNSNNVVGSPTIKPIGALVFGVPVTLKLRNALQAVQFPHSSVCHPTNVDYNTDPDGSGPLPKNSESQACMPTLSNTEMRSLYTGVVGKWDSFMVIDPSNPTGPMIKLASHPDVAGFLPADTKVEICRRVPGSGTQTQNSAIFLNAPCDPNSLPPASGSNTLSGPIVALNSGSGDVEKCLDDFNNGTNNSTQNSSLTTRWGIGLQSTEFNAGLGKDYRFVKVDGYAPTIQSVAAGHYYDYAELTEQWRTDINTMYNASSTADKNDTLTIANYIATNAHTPAVLAHLNLGYVHPFGQGGWLAIPSSTQSPSNPFSISNPVNSSTRAPLGRTPNTCQMPVSVKANSVQVDSSF